MNFSQILVFNEDANEAFYGNAVAKSFDNHLENTAFRTGELFQKLT